MCRNNKYAISTPTEDQYKSDGVIPRSISTGVASIRVDGNDTIACLEVTKYAREYILREKKPFFIEFMTYRVGDHSTSDKSSLYRSDSEVNEWKEKNNPLHRLTKFLSHYAPKDLPDEKEERKAAQKTIIDALHSC